MSPVATVAPPRPVAGTDPQRQPLRVSAAAEIRWVECPRDAWQALPRALPTERKRAHLAALLAAGFRFLDMGSFVSPKHVPQLADTEAVLAGLPAATGAELLAIVGNARGLERAAATRRAAGAGRAVDAVGYPLSVDATFQRRNLGRSPERSWRDLEALHAGARAAGLAFVVYLSMGFGNPYGNPWEPADTARALERVRTLGIERVALADTVGRADAATVAAVLDACAAPEALGVHLHARPDGWAPLLTVALERGVRWFEGAFGGLGGCPFADDDLVGNLPSERVLPWLAARGFGAGVDAAALPALASDAATIAASYG